MLFGHEINHKLYWVPTHNEIVGNELENITAKEANEWKMVQKRSGKFCEIDTAFQTLSPFLKTVAKAYLNKLLYEK